MLSISWIFAAKIGSLRGRADLPAAREVNCRLCMAVVAFLLLAMMIAATFSRFGTEPRDREALRAAETQRLNGLVQTLKAEGAVTELGPCPSGPDACVTVSALFKTFRPSDRRAIGAMLEQYFTVHPISGSGTVAVHFIDADTGVELRPFRMPKIH